MCQTSCDVSSFLFGLKCFCVKAVSFALPYMDHVEVALQWNSFIIAHRNSFLKPPDSLSHHANTRDHTSPSAPRCLFRLTLEMQASYISKLFLESGAYTAITRVVPKRVAVHLSSNFHYLLVVQNCSETNNVANPDLHTHIQAVPDWAHPRTWSLEWRGWQGSACTREQAPTIFPSWWKCLKTVGGSC